MAILDITPEQFTFESFRHSQGGLAAQLGIFRYGFLSRGIKPCLELSESELKRYRDFISDPKSKRHLAMASNGTTSVVEYALNQLRMKILGRNEFGAYASVEELLPVLGSYLLKTEVRILGGEPDSEYDYDHDKMAKKEARVAERVRRGKTSFVLFHGMSGNSTGYILFDQMYSGIYNLIINGEINQTLIEQHTSAVENAQSRFTITTTS